MKFLIVVILVSASCVSGFRRQSEHVSEYDFKTVHDVKSYSVPEKKLDNALEAKLEVLNQILKAHQQGRKTEVTLKTEVQANAGDEEAVGGAEGQEEDAVPNYEFGYGVKDSKTGDHKNQWEKRVGDQVKGSYQFAESDGTQRVVEYEADDKKGFEAKVKNVEWKDNEEVTLEEANSDKSKKDSKVAHSYSYLKKYFS